MAELQGGEELSAAAQADLWNHDPEFVAEFQEQREKGLEAQLKALEDGANQKRFQNAVVRAGGDERQAKRLIAAEDAEQAAREAQRQGVMS
tara:strand:- start:735 stop:1007 length:273 start_codon:yes stop_codon:yes gene_type:complete